MESGYSVEGITCLLCASLVGYFGGIKKIARTIEAGQDEAEQEDKRCCSCKNFLHSSRSCVTCWNILVYIWNNTRYSLNIHVNRLFLHY